MDVALADTPPPSTPETFSGSHARYAAALEAIADRHAPHNVLVVTHADAVHS